MPPNCEKQSISKFSDHEQHLTHSPPAHDTVLMVYRPILYLLHRTQIIPSLLRPNLFSLQLLDSCTGPQTLLVGFSSLLSANGDEGYADGHNTECLDGERKSSELWSVALECEVTGETYASGVCRSTNTASNVSVP